MSLQVEHIFTKLISQNSVVHMFRWCIRFCSVEVLTRGIRCLHWEIAVPLTCSTGEFGTHQLVQWSWLQVSLHMMRALLAMFFVCKKFSHSHQPVVVEELMLAIIWEGGGVFHYLWICLTGNHRKPQLLQPCECIKTMVLQEEMIFFRSYKELPL